MAAATEKTFTKGQTVILNNDEYGTPRVISQVRIGTGRFSRGEVIFKLDGDSSFTKEWQVTPIGDVTPEMEAKFAKARAKRDRAIAKEQRERDAANAHEKGVRETFADKLRAAPEVLLPVTHKPSRYQGDGGQVGTTIRYWEVQGRGLDAVVAQREVFVGVDIRRDHYQDPVTGKRVHKWGVSFGGTTYDQLTAGLMAEAIQCAISEVIPTLGDPRPAWDLD